MPNEFIIRNGFISLDNSQITGSLTVSQGITGSLFGTSSFTLNAVTASFAITPPASASYAATASSADNFLTRQDITASSLIVTQNTRLSGSVSVTGSVDFSYLASVWSTGGAMITARTVLAGAGTQNEGLAFGGSNAVDPNPANTRNDCTNTEEYDGTTWATGGGLPAKLGRLAGTGTQNSGLGVSGTNLSASPFLSPFCCTVEYNGTSWSSGGNPGISRIFQTAVGTQNEALAFGGGIWNNPPIFPPAYPNTNCGQEYNGTSWSAGGNLITARLALAGAGTQNQGLAFGAPTCTEEYNGTSWAAGGAMITGRSGLAGAGSQNAALGFGSPTTTEEYDGNTWTTRGSMIAGRAYFGGAGVSTQALAFGSPTCTEEYNCSTFAAFSYSSTTGQLAASGSLFGTASFALTASFVTSASLTSTASFVTSASFAITASFTPTASVAQVASFIRSASFAQVGNSVNLLNQNVTISGSLGVFVGSSSRLRVESAGAIIGAAITDTSRVTGSLLVTGSLVSTGSVDFSFSSGGSFLRSFSFTTPAGMVILPRVSSSLNFANDAAAAAGGVELGGLYRSGSLIQIRVT